MPDATELPVELQKKIAQARDLPGRPHAERLTDLHTFARVWCQQVQTRPDQPYLIYYSEQGQRSEFTYAQFAQRVNQYARLLHFRLRLQRGQRLCTGLHNHYEAIALNFAAWTLGLSVVPLNMTEDDKRLSYVLEHSGAKALFTFQEYAERLAQLRQNAKQIEHAIVLDGPCIGWKSLDAEFAQTQARTPLPDQAQADDECLVVYTSGTTGAPKGVALTQYNLVADAHSITHWHGFKPEHRLICVLPIHHVNGLIVTHVTPAYYGGSVVLNRKFQPSNYFERIAKENVYAGSVVPTLLQFLLEGSTVGLPASASKFSYLICGAGPLTVDLAARFEDRFGIPIVHGYGLSESVCYSCFIPAPPQANKNDPEYAHEHRHWMRDFGFPSIGVPVLSNEMAIHDEHGQALGPGQKGEIVIRGHNIMLGYANNLKANTDAFTHGWFRSGDEGFYQPNARGQPCFFISGRFKELIIRGGVKISPLEVDEVLNRAPGVQAGMAVGFEHTAFGEEVGAYIVKKAGANPTPDELIAFCKANLAAHAVPKVVVFGETFPVTSTGKYQRNQLKPLFALYKDTRFKS